MKNRINKMMQLKYEQKLFYILRIASAMCFIGHGAWGIITKEIWTNYFAVFGIGRELAYELMPAVGCFDILLGIILLFYPVRAIPMWLVLWGAITALLRPLSGEPFAEFIERSGNFGAPLALLFITGVSGNFPDWFKRISNISSPDIKKINQAIVYLRIVVFLLFLGHGWLNIIQKDSLITEYKAIGFSNPVQVAQTIGMLEILSAIMVLIKPLRPLIFGLFIWKMFSELFYPQYTLFEWIERGGSYGSVLALWVLLDGKKAVTYLSAESLVLKSIKI